MLRKRIRKLARACALSLALALTFTTPVSAATAPEGLVVSTDMGKVRGAPANGVENFLGIPFAEPPVGGLRWQPPQPKRPWNGVRSAEKFGARCPAPASADGPRTTTEDCLFVNVQRPAGVRPGDRLPVYVYIHGGGLTTGAGSLYSADKIVRRAGVVGVTFNYRLGAFGFLGHPGLTAPQGHSGNYGFLDQQAALRWVQRNIAAFGGDPEKVTLGGESAGGWSVCSHLAAPGSTGLFSQAVIQSGSCPTRTQEQAHSAGKRLAAELGCPDPATAVRCLRAVPAKKILKAGFAPAMVRGGPVLPTDPRTAIRTGDFTRVPVMIGANLDEGRLFTVGNIGWDRKQYVAWVRENFGRNADAVLQRYPWPEDADRFTPAYLTGAIMNDAGLIGTAKIKAGIGGCGNRDLTRDIAKHVRTYAYEWAPRNSPGLLNIPGYVNGATHAAENAYLFPGYKQQGTPVSSRFGPDEWQLSDDVVEAWGRFVTTGAPGISGLPEWPAYAAQGVQPSLRAGGRTVLITDRTIVDEHKCAFWDSVSAD